MKLNPKNHSITIKKLISLTGKAKIVRQLQSNDDSSVNYREFKVKEKKEIIERKKQRECCNYKESILCRLI